MLEEFQNRNLRIHLLGVQLNYKISPRREGDIEQVWADTSIANKKLGWKTEKSLADALYSAWEWEKSIKTFN